MLTIDPQGMVIQDARIIARREPKIERGRMDKVNGIVVHQTNTPTEAAVFDQLTQALAVPKAEIHRHPDVSYKNRTEASTAAWQ
ncbi:hypothetical protein [Acidovorax sp. NCPPB 4044]|uniref:hypothetical protein n=1 Tax=Acidovorax sp. NCPPB 4044 TaxID=2940490 RepID=UPI002304636F|nr:hypothetical protein [Acidovorax sp. NCPPB 4044]MDA8519222.1 hypothetical protein [Acidovorax sp. NCPPB 4044]